MVSGFALSSVIISSRACSSPGSPNFHSTLSIKSSHRPGLSSSHPIADFISSSLRVDLMVPGNEISRLRSALIILSLWPVELHFSSISTPRSRISWRRRRAVVVKTKRRFACARFRRNATYVERKFAIELRTERSRILTWPDRSLTWMLMPRSLPKISRSRSSSPSQISTSSSLRSSQARTPRHAW